MAYYTNPSEWALGYLRGRAKGFAKGNLTITHVLGAARRAFALGATPKDIAAVLETYELSFDLERDVVIQLPERIRLY